MSNEPVVSLVVGLIAAGAAVLAAFGVPVTAEQIAALTGFAAAALGVAVYVRSKVTPTGKATPGAGERGLSLLEALVVLLLVAVAVLAVIVLT